MRKFVSRRAAAACVVVALACGGSDESPSKPAAPPAAATPKAEAGPRSSAPPSLDRALVLALASFGPRQKGGGMPEPEPASMEFLVREDGEWKVRVQQDAESNVFHKAMHYVTEDGQDVILSAAGSAATIKTWQPSASGLAGETLWKKDFGGKFSRMRDIEVADLFGDGKRSIAIATHDQGVVATMHPDGQGGYEIVEIDQESSTFVHEIEIGDLDGDGVLEVYATPSEPNRLDGRPQSGSVVRYVPARKEGRVVVGDLGERHAKEILVDDVDGDGRDELYVSVEGHVDKESNTLEHGVTILRFDADTPADQGIVIAEIEDRLSRFLTAGDVDGDGKKEMVAATFSSGLWLLRPGEDPRGLWEAEIIDRDSGGFEHAALLTDLDGDGRDELYVASDKHGEVRRYFWDSGRPEREIIMKRSDGRSIFTWNLMAVPSSLAP